MKENEETVCDKVPLPIIISKLEDIMREKYSDEIRLRYQNVPYWVQEDLDKMIREHNRQIDSTIDR